MRDFLNKFKIPTLLGLSVIIIGIIGGVFLNLREQTIISKASPDVTPQNIILSNIGDNSVTISWQTSVPVASFVKFGQTHPDEQVILDDRDSKNPQPHTTHYVTIKKLLPKTIYQYRIVSNKIQSDIMELTTAAPLSAQTGFQPIIGSVLDNNTPVGESIIYLVITDATVQSALTKTEGNFLIPLSQLRKSDLSDIYPLKEDTVAKLTVISAKGEASALFRLNDAEAGLPPITLGENLDLTLPANALAKYDLNGDGIINAADNATVLQNFGPNPKNAQADLNGDGVVDQKDLDAVAKQINQ